MGDEHKFTVHEHMFKDGEYKFKGGEYKISITETNCLRIVYAEFSSKTGEPVSDRYDKFRHRFGHIYGAGIGCILHSP